MQPKLFEVPTETVEIEKVILYALGDFQSRGKVLADRELALDRLRGAFLRAYAKFLIRELSDEQVIEALLNLGINVIEVPNFVAKRPYRITVSQETAKQAETHFRLSA
ncbi:MAG: hypothetical protein ACR2M8_08835 [Pyrinomonadaceae bacterium]